MLLNHGANVDVQDNKLWTPLIIAAMHGNLEVVKALVGFGANMGIEDIEGKTAREYATEALENELSKASQDLKVKKKINELTCIRSLLPDEDKEGEVIDDDMTPNHPQTKIKQKDNKI